MTSLDGDGVRLALVLGETGVDSLNNIRADRGLEDGREGGGGSAGLAIGADDRNGRSGRLRAKKSAIRPNFIVRPS